jgi:hypothetical protein
MLNLSQFHRVAHDLADNAIGAGKTGSDIASRAEERAAN